MTTFYITTPIYYVNDVPHLGHAYTTLVADTLAKFHRMRGDATRFLTGTDEHGQKIEEAATKRGLTPQQLVDQVAPRFDETWKALGIEGYRFIRTTDPKHKQVVAALWKRIRAHNPDDLYLASYQGWYCVGCEAFYTESQLIKDGDSWICPVHKRAVNWLDKERSWFFRLSRYAEPLLRHIAANPDFIRPEQYRREIVSFLEGGLKDLSVSRTSFSWGIPAPEPDPEGLSHVIYVWMDALTNYLSDLCPPGGAIEGPDVATFWPRAVHLIGKDILRFHAVYWPAFLMAANLPLPAGVFAHGWWTIRGEKISKSMPATRIDPIKLANALDLGPLSRGGAPGGGLGPKDGGSAGGGLGPKDGGPAGSAGGGLGPKDGGPAGSAGGGLGVDAMRYYLLREVPLGLDGDFTFESLFGRFNAELANDLGNLVNRSLTLLAKSPLPPARDHALVETVALHREIEAGAAEAIAQAASAFEALAPSRALEAIWKLVRDANRYVDATQPWALAKDPQRHGELAHVLHELAAVIGVIGGLVTPVLPTAGAILRAWVGVPEADRDRWPDPTAMHRIAPTAALAKTARPLFPRLDEPTQAKIFGQLVPPELAAPAAAAPAPAPKPAAPAPAAAPITYDDFAKVELRVGKVLSAARVAKKDKLLHLQVDLGEAQPRSIVAGIAQAYAPEELAGKQVLVVANLAPRKLAGLVSQGMILAAGDEEILGLSGLDRDVPPGTRVR